MLDRLRTPLLPALVVAGLAIAPARWLGWTNEAASLLWLPLRPVAHLGVAASSWLRPPTPVPVVDVAKLAEERDELLALAQRLRAELDASREAIAILEGLPRPAESPSRPIAAEVIAVEPSGIVSINVGLRHGVSVGDPVVAAGGRLVGRIGDPLGINAGVVVPAARIGVAEPRVRIEGGSSGSETVLCLLEPTGDGWRGEVAATRVETGAEVRLDDPAWPSSAQGLLLGRVASLRDVPERPLRASIRVRPAWSIGDGRTLVVQRSAPDPTP